MKKQSTINSKRNEIQQENRRQHLRNVFGQHRRTLNQGLTKFQKQQFERIYPQIDEDNFQSHLNFIYKYSCNNDYNFRLVVFSGYLYQFLLGNPENQQAIKILESLSYYEELQFPQTEEFAVILVKNLQKNTLAILQIVYNLLQTSKYFACLRDYLIQLDFNNKLENLLKSHPNYKQKQAFNYTQQLYLGILCSFISTHPLVQNSFFEDLLKKTLQISENNSDWTTMGVIALNDLFSSIEQERLKAQLVLKIYGKVMIKEYFSCEYEVISIIFYAVKCDIIVERSYWKLLSISLQSINSQIVQKIIMICEMLAKHENFRQEMVEMFISNNFLNRFLKAYDLCQQKSKLRILQVLNTIVSQILVDSQQISEDNRLNLDELTNIFKNGLQSSNQVIVERVVDLVFFSLQVSNERQMVMVQLPFREHLQQQGVVQLLTNIHMDKQYLSQKIEFILGLLQEQDKNDKGQI